ncbi:MAG: toxin-antitoxin system YwqK family antitoxin [Prolixibacteraceae bacterium]
MVENLIHGLPEQFLINDDDPLNGTKKVYYPNGKIMKEYIVKNGKLDGSYKFYNESGILLTDQNFRNGMPDGYFKSYYENGQLQADLNLKEGLPQGVSKEYYENGTLKKESNLTGEPFELSGKSISYFENGKVDTEITTSRGKLVYSISYDLEGRVTREDSEGKSISYWYENNGKKHVVINGVPQD